MPSRIKAAFLIIMQVILASASPRRKELFSEVIKDFEIIPAKGEERADLSVPPAVTAQKLAKAKCDEVFAMHGDALVVGCDTVVVYGGKIYGKPKDEEDAKRTLLLLSGKTHSVITGVCVRYRDKIAIKSVETQVTFNALSQKFINGYVATRSPLDKAGSYGIQDEGIVKSYVGSFTNVVGLPVEEVKKMMEEVLKDDAFGN